MENHAQHLRTDAPVLLAGACHNLLVFSCSTDLWINVITACKPNTILDQIYKWSMIHLRYIPHCSRCLSHLPSLSPRILCVGIAARETAQALKTLAQAARGVAASTTDPKAAAAMLDSARDVMEGSALLIHEAKQALVAPGDAESQQRLAQVSCSRTLLCSSVLFDTTGDSWCCSKFESSGPHPSFTPQLPCQQDNPTKKTKADSKVKDAKHFIKIAESSCFILTWM